MFLKIWRTSLSEEPVTVSADAEGKLALLAVMDRVARLKSLRYFVVGAMARDILMYHLHGFPLNRASPDIDFAMAIENWPIGKGKMPSVR